MRDKLPCISSAVISVKTVDELFDALSTLPPLICCQKCGTKLLHANAIFVSTSGKVWTLPLPVCTNCEPSKAGSYATPLPEEKNFMIQFDKALHGGPSLSKALPSITPSEVGREGLY